MSLRFDGERILGDADASLVSALVGAGHLQLARSPKFHRPRGPACLRGGCDGCLVRVDDLPNQMACTMAAREGAKVERQNVVLSSKLDVLRATDWFFPDGMNHHEMFAGVPGVQKVMLAFARRVSGLGELPVAPAEIARKGLATMETDVLVVGAGPSGLSTSIALARAGMRVACVDDRLAPGGTLLCFPPGARIGDLDVDARLERLVRDARDAGVQLHTETTALGVHEGDDWLVDHPTRGLHRIKARAHVIATGAHDATPLFEGNDLPGVMSARAAGRLLREGVLVGEAIALVGDGPHARAFAAAAVAEGARVERVAERDIVSVRGMSRVRSALLRDARGAEIRIDCDAVVCDAAPAPSYELAAEAGAGVRHVDEGYAVLVDDTGRVRLPGEQATLVSAPRLAAVGEVVGAPLDLDAFAESAARVARVLVSTLRPSIPPPSRRAP